MPTISSDERFAMPMVSLIGIASPSLNAARLDFNCVLASSKTKFPTIQTDHGTDRTVQYTASAQSGGWAGHGNKSQFRLSEKLWPAGPARSVL